MSNIDQAIVLGLSEGKDPESIAKSLNIPVDWVLEMQDNLPAPKVAVIDLPKQYGMN